ncbi:MAG: phage baseplate assembly protein V [Alphaproteobacteria bacterium]|jgi:phage baseplate assembly protein gpV|nr:phage baseplate assembly protein V [Alphaproteobacteria bacterium]
MINLIKRIFKIEERLNNLIRFGVIKQINTENNYVIVDLGNNLESPELPYLVNSSSNAIVYFIPKIGDQVVIIAKNGDISHSLVIPICITNKR